MNKIKGLVIWLIVLGFLGYAGWQAFQYISDQQHPRIPLTVSGSTFNVRVAATDADREKGLSGTQQLASNEGMLFVFNSNDTWGIWMKDMLYPIDIVWLNDQKQIIYIVKRADPSSYPYTTYKPTEPARYVIELPSGTADKKALKISDKASFDVSGQGGDSSS